MSLIMITGLQQLPPTHRWPRLVGPLAEELAYSGLGTLPDLESLRREFDETGNLQATELAADIFNYEYGRPLLDRVLESAGVKRAKPVVPARWRGFNCEDYFNSPLAEHGYRDEDDQYEYIRPAQDVYEDPERQFLVIGDAGVDGIDWGYRRGQSGLWAYYPIRDEFVKLAPTAEALLQGWLDGDISA